MRKAPVLLLFLSIFIAGCDRDNGANFLSQKVPSKLKVLIERQIKDGPNDWLVVYAMDFHKEGRTLTLVCPCHIPGSFESLLNVRVEGESLKLTLLPDAEYNVEVQYWALNADNNTKVQFQISR